MFLRSIKQGLQKRSQTVIANAAKGSSMKMHTRGPLMFQSNMLRFRMAQMSFNNKNQPLNKPAGLNASPAYLDQMYSQWRQNPASVDESWQEYFGSETGATSAPASDLQRLVSAIQQSGVGATPSHDLSQCQADGMKLMTYVRAFYTHGHLNADVDPLQLDKVYSADLVQKFNTQRADIKKLLDHHTHGFSELDLDRTFSIDYGHFSGLISTKEQWTLRELRDELKKAYCGKIGLEYMHIPDRDQCNWLRNHFELRHQKKLTNQQKKRLLDRLLWCDEFAAFITTKFNTMKRFGLEGCESFIPGMKTAMDVITETGGKKAIIGMPHRGRLNMLVNVVRKPLEIVFAEFQGVMPSLEDRDQNWQDHSGDVKYHLGTSYTREYPNGKELTVEILANPSHLECINPVVMGRVRAEHHTLREDEKTPQFGRDQIVPFLIHGDASFAGQGVCYESLQMQDLKNYTVGGTIHVIVNNQIGFTTVPAKGRSGMYSSDLAKSINAPIIHVNADSIEDVHYAFSMAAEYRQLFNHDVVIDLIGYRKMGHNELDQPSFTQPLMYKQVAKMVPVAKLYENELLANGTITPEEVRGMKTTILDILEDAYKQSKTLTYKAEDWETEQWDAIKVLDAHEAKSSGLELDRLRDVGNTISTLPADKTFHRLVRKIFETRNASIQDGVGIDWGTAEALAFATLIQDGYHVRISGQDVERGTFSHRHAHVFYQNEMGYHTPINQIVGESDSRKFIASNSHLSEFAVMGYELGYAQTHPNTLVLWEAQFGDFANGAQVIIDQFYCSGEAKWNVKNGLVLLLPHGYDGNGPEHSSSRVERYLLLCDQDEFVPGDGATYENEQILQGTNMQVVLPSTAANYFHLLRTQMRLPFRKPLVVVSPKKLLRFKGATSEIEDFGPGTRFQLLIGDKHPNLVAPEKVRKVVLCSGQVYFDLEARRERDGKDDIAIVRVESYCPFPFKEIIAELQRYKNAEVVWAQEEPKNAGAWTYFQPRLRNIQRFLGKEKKELKIQYAGRPIAAATAVGFAHTHNAQLAALLDEALA